MAETIPGEDLAVPGDIARPGTAGEARGGRGAGSSTAGLQRRPLRFAAGPGVRRPRPAPGRAVRASLEGDRRRPRAHRPELRSSDDQAWPGPRHPQRHPPRGRVRAPGSALHATALDAGAAARDDAQGGVPARVAVSEVQPAADRRRIDRPGPSGRAQERTERDRQAGAPGAPARDRSRPERGRAALRSRPHASGPHQQDHPARAFERGPGPRRRAARRGRSPAGGPVARRLRATAARQSPRPRAESVPGVVLGARPGDGGARRGAAVGVPPLEFSYDEFKADVAKVVRQSESQVVAQMMGRNGDGAGAPNGLETLVNDLFRVAYRHGLYVPPSATLLIKAIVTIEGVARSLNPNLNVVAMAVPIVLKSLRPPWLSWRYWKDRSLARLPGGGFVQS